jgi:hypothetical protein
MSSSRARSRSVISSNPSRDEGPMGTGRRLARSAAPEGSGEMASTPRRKVLQGSRSIPTSTARRVRSSSQSIKLRAIREPLFDAEAYRRALERPQPAESERGEPPKRPAEAAVGPFASELAASPGCSARALAPYRARSSARQRSHWWWSRQPEARAPASPPRSAHRSLACPVPASLAVRERSMSFKRTC